MKAIEYIIKNWREIALISLLFLSAILVYRNDGLTRNLAIKNHNIEVLNDSMRYWRTKEGEWMYEKGIIIAENKEAVEKLTSIKNEEIKSLERELKNKIAVISTLSGKIDFLENNIKELETTLETNKDSTEYKLNFILNDPWRTLEGHMLLHSSVKPTYYAAFLTKDIINLHLKTGLTEDFKIFVTSDCPYVNIASIDGAVLNPDYFMKSSKPKRWFFGPVVGGGYNLPQNKFGLFFGFGFGYGIVSW